MATDIECQRKTALDVEQPVGQAFGHFAKQEVVIGEAWRGALTVGAHAAWIEYRQRGPGIAHDMTNMGRPTVRGQA
jgi:hypothetical protein